ncbi:helix-turn-helix domain-containing protein [Nocardia coubleae]|uniref:Helix-turn-helix domain-containing protein n=1 Tax=Nocardia coubleae TaxID=356147 RepID=A0A846W7T5_9NOCA|nr:helix-turn-helix domain-containing protein [Nocardia coubleae]NKX88518.1 helix-turn-helix domain-containing protein [Nocardia coubleae]
MEDPHLAIARYLRERREAAGLTRVALSARAGISPALIQKIEQGSRTPTLEALTALFDALDVPALFRDHLVSLSLADRYGSPAADIPSDIPTADLVLLNSISYPASLQMYTTYDVVATNSAWNRYFPGLDTSTTLLEWMLLDPRSREVMLDWDKQVHLCVYGFRVMSPGVVPKERIDRLFAACAVAEEWERFWTTEPDVPSHLDRPVQRFRHPETGAAVAMTMQVHDSIVPRREWSLVTFCPLLDGSVRDAANQ